MDDTASSFEGRTAVVTGAGSGIGEALARHAAGLGMRLVLADLSEDRLGRVAGELAGSSPVLAVQTDVSDWDAVERLAARAYGEMGPVHLLFNNAGIETTGPMWELSPERFDRMMRVNVSGVFHGIRAFVPRMLAAGEPARVVNFSSIGGLSVGPYQASYIASKFAVQALTESLSMELTLAGAPVRVSVVNPGPVATRIFEDAEALEGGGGGAAGPVREQMRALLRDHGITPAEAAAVVFDGVARGDFWIFPHPEMAREVIERRYRMLSEGRAPDVQRFA